MTVGAICNRRIPTAPRTATIEEAARSMCAFDERVVVVTDETDGKRRAVGVVTEHEMMAVIARGADPAQLTLGEIMRAHPGFVRDTDSIFDTVRWMHRNRLREIVVHDESGRLVGLVTYDQLFDAIAGEFTAPDLPALEESLTPDRTALH